ncbi:reverse transcriptase [Penicillium digitatum]|uniref:Reverse transcriptase n=1 Tax=Penicillium digitatum TaxID=36651 RepID=A0A7T6XJC1_PENDI|nr:reverse transcriptase [Penicillium digitatum]
MASFLSDKAVQKADVIAVQEPWINSQSTTTHYPNKATQTSLPKELEGERARVCSKAKATAAAERLLDIAGIHNLSLTTETGSPTWRRNEQASVLDLTFVSNTLAERVVECQVGTDHGSDHYPVVTTIDIADDVEAECQAFIQIINDAVDISTPWAIPSQWANPSFTPECQEAVKEVRQLRRRHERTGDPYDKELYKAARNRKTRLIKIALRRYHRRKVQEVIEEGPGGMWRMSKWARNRQGAYDQGVTPSIKIPGGLAETVEEKAAAFQQAFFPVPPPADLSDIDSKVINHDPTEINRGPIRFPEITHQEIKQAVKASPPDKAPGEDGLPNSLWHKLIEIPTVLDTISRIYNACIRLDLVEGCEGVKTSGWVDDVAFIVIGKDEHETISKLQKACQYADAWAARHASVFDPKKYALIHFVNPESGGEEHTPLVLQGTTVQATTTAERYLGVWLDPGLTFQHHRQQMLAKAGVSLQALRGLTGSTWGASLSAMRAIYQAVMIPQMLFGAAAWHSPLTSTLRERSYVKQFANIQSRAACLMSGAFKTTAREALDIELHLLPMQQQLDRLVQLAAIRIRTGPAYAVPKTMLVERGHMQKQRGGYTPMEAQTWKKGGCLTTPLGPLASTWESRKAYIQAPWTKPPRVYIEERERAINTHKRTTEQLYAPARLYTDGSGYQGGIGAAVYPAYPYRRNEARLCNMGTDDDATVYAAELRAIEMALEVIKERFNDDNEWRDCLAKSGVVIFTDNQATLRAIQNPRMPSGQGLRKATTSVLIQLRTGIIGLAEYLSKIKRSDSPRCQCDLGNQSVKHVLLECPLLKELRSEMVEELFMEGVSTTLGEQAMLTEVKAAPIVAKFMIASGLLGQFQSVDSVAMGKEQGEEDSKPKPTQDTANVGETGNTSQWPGARSAEVTSHQRTWRTTHAADEDEEAWRHDPNLFVFDLPE